MTKVLPRLKHHVRTANGISTEKHRGKNGVLGGTGQGNVFLGTACRDASCIVLKTLKIRI